MLLCFYITRQNNSLQSSFSDLIKGTIEPQNTKEKEIPKPPELQDLEFLTS
jgi:hypothetical protein